MDVRAPRRVVLICGPPGAGKTAYAKTLGLDVYDRDDEQWASERQFVAAIRRLKHDANAQAAVIRTGATASARARAAALIDATEVKILDVDLDTCIQRIRQRRRTTPPMSVQIVAARGWWHRYLAPPTTPKPKPRYDWQHRKLRQSLAPLVAAGGADCWRCGKPIDPAERWDLGHDDTDPTKYRGPEHLRCNRATSSRRTQREPNRWVL